MVNFDWVEYPIHCPGDHRCDDGFTKCGTTIVHEPHTYDSCIGTSHCEKWNIIGTSWIGCCKKDHTRRCSTWSNPRGICMNGLLDAACDWFPGGSGDNGGCKSGFACVENSKPDDSGCGGVCAVH